MAEFAKEREMLQPVLSWVRAQHLAAIPEFSTAWGICDIVAASPNKTRLNRRLKYNQLTTVGSLMKLRLLEIIPEEKSGQYITYHRLCGMMKEEIASTSLKSALRSLLRRHFIISPHRNCYQKRNGWMPLQKRLITIEMKMNRVSDALFQAYNNLRIATESYVAMPSESVIRLIKNSRLEDFENMGVGLIAVNREECKIIRRSKPQNIENHIQLQALYVERFWKIWVTGS